MEDTQDAQETGEFYESTTMIDGNAAQLMVQTVHNAPSELTMLIHNDGALVELQREMFDYECDAELTDLRDLVLAATFMIERSKMVLNVNAFIATAYCLVELHERERILHALKLLFKRYGIVAPEYELDIILGCCRK